MTSKLMIAATVGMLSLATTAFAGQNSADQGSGGAAYTVGFDNTTLPENGSQGAVQSPNSLPPGFETGTVAELHAQSVDRWFASQAVRHHYAQAQQVAPRS